MSVSEQATVRSPSGPEGGADAGGRDVSGQSAPVGGMEDTDGVDELLVEEISIDGMCGVY